jgi:hypothetical protein
VSGAANNLKTKNLLDDSFMSKSTISLSQLTNSLQESVLTLLFYAGAEATEASALLSASYFDGDYQDIAARVLSYRRKYNAAPGDAHIDDLFDHVLSDPKNKKAALYRRIIESIIEQSKSLNARYVSTRLIEFIRQQSLKTAVLEAAQRYGSGGDDLVPDIENILHKALSLRVKGIDAGTFLSDTEKSFKFLDRRERSSIKIGIPELDRYNLCPERRTMLLFMAPTGRGKSWFGVHCGKEAILQGERVVHIVNEMSEEQLIERYFMAWLAATKRNEDYDEMDFVFDKLNRFVGMKPVTRRAKINFSDPNIHNVLKKKVSAWGARLGRIVIKDFPTDQLTVPMIEAYLDALEQEHDFHPSVLIVDSPDLMETKADHMRESTGKNFKALRGLFMERNLAGVVTTQSNRSGAAAKTVREEHVSEDFTKLQTADKSIIYSQTDVEERYSIARLYAHKNRGDKKGYTTLITQNYTTGQFCRNSTTHNDMYWKELRRLKGDTEEE